MPRAFYEKSRYFKEYRSEDSGVIEYLQWFEKGRFGKIDFMGAYF